MSLNELREQEGLFISKIPFKRKSVKSGDTFITGPCRIAPGKLSVARTIGDIKAKHPIYGGNPRVIIPEADVFYEKIDDGSDLIAMCSSSE